MKVIGLYEHNLDGILDVVRVDTSGYSPISGLCKIEVYKRDINGCMCVALYTNINKREIIFN